MNTWELYKRKYVCYIEDKKFGNLECYLLIIDKVLYGLLLSGLRWHDKFANCLHEMGFIVSKTEPDIWMRLNDEHDFYEYISVYIDDLAITSKNCEDIIQYFTEKYNFKMKNTGTIKYHLGMDFSG